MPKNKKREDILARKRELERKRYEKIKNNPELYAKYKEKNKKKYQKRKLEGKVVSINNLTPRDQKMLRKKWREDARRSYQRKKEEKARIQRFIECNSPPTSPDIENININNINDLREQPSTSAVLNYQSKRINRSHSRSREVSPANSQGSSVNSGIISPNAQKLVRKLRYKKDKEIASLRLKLQSVIKLNDTYRKKISRMRPLQENRQDNVRSVKLFSKLQSSQNASHDDPIAEGVLRSYKSVKSYKMKQMISNSLQPHLETSIHATKFKSQFKNLFRARSLPLKNMSVLQKKNDIKIFLSADDNSSCAAGKKEYVKKDGVKEQKRYLNDSLGNLHKKFMSSHRYAVSFSTFCRFRPFWILPASKRPRETCLCVIHENFKLFVSALHKYKIIEPKDPTNLLKTICCSENNAKCLFRDCPECKNKSIKYLEYDRDIVFCYWTWNSKTENIVQNGCDKVIRLVKKEKIVSIPNIAIQKFEEIIEKYMNHCGRMVSQQKAIKEIKERLNFDEAVIHIDYSENYKCGYSKEIQSAHFGASKPQITIHTSVLYFFDVNRKKQTQCFATLSPNLRHDSAAVWAHMEPLLDFLRIHSPQVKTFHIISDSAGSQYRNYKIYFVITALKWNYPDLKCVTWNYSESGHGKGAPDGVGAVLKRTADASVSHGNDVQDFESFTLLLKDKLQNIKIDTILDYKIFEKDLLLPNTLLPFKGTQKVHQIVWSNTKPKMVVLRELSCTKETCLTYAEFCKHGKHLGFHRIITEEVISPAISRCSRKRSSAMATTRISENCFDSDEDSFVVPGTNVADDFIQPELVTVLHRSTPFSALSEMELPPELQRSTLDNILDEGPANVTMSPLNSFKNIEGNDSDSDYTIF